MCTTKTADGKFLRRPEPLHLVNIYGGQVYNVRTMQGKNCGATHDAFARLNIIFVSITAHMLTILQEISKHALLLNKYDFTQHQRQSQWLGMPPATHEEIETAKASLQTELPNDYIEFLKITNGFPQCNSIGVSFLPVSKIDYLININEDLVEIWNSFDELKDVGQGLSEALLVGGLNEEQYLLLIPLGDIVKHWRYWKFANWIPGQEEYNDLSHYLNSELNFLKQQTEGLQSR